MWCAPVFVKNAVKRLPFYTVISITDEGQEMQEAGNIFVWTIVYFICTIEFEAVKINSSALPGRISFSDLLQYHWFRSGRKAAAAGDCGFGCF